MSTELKAGDTITAESLNGIAEGAYTFKSGEILTASKLNTISEAIEDKDEEIAELEGQVEELQAIIDAFPTIESLNVTQNGTYQEAGKAYTPVDVSVSSVAVEALSVTQNGTYSEQGKAYSPVTVNVPEGYSFREIRNGSSLVVVNNTSSDIYFSDIPAFSSSTQNDPLVIISVPICAPANGSVGFSIANKKYFYKDGKNTRMIIPAMGGLSGKTVNADGISTVSVSANTNGIFITISPEVSSPLIQYTVTISE